ncbi:MAG TPA: alpha/beta hydrolase fold domain-containing protein [Solimonas sp.]|nr:alpha/beta hydrolase fold domain-containing protein [Solimonas sp.]
MSETADAVTAPSALSTRARVMRAVMRGMVKPVFALGLPVRAQRIAMRAMTATNPVARGNRFDQIDLGGVPALRAQPAQTPERTVLFFHGGAYCIGSPQTHRGLISHLARAARAAVYAPRYRKAPESPHPAALDDALAAYRGLLAAGATRVALAGDSAGGGLALALAHAIRDQGLPQPTALVLISPWLDLTLAGASHAERAARDPLLSGRWLADSARHYAGADTGNPAVSPAFGEPAGLPPMLIPVGSEEILISDSEDLAGSAAEAGVPVQLHEFDGMWHDFQLHAGLLRESDEAVAEIAEFLRARAPAGFLDDSLFEPRAGAP